MAKRIVIRGQILPLDDLSAENRPEQFLTVGTDLEPVLAVLAAQGPNGGKLVQVDANGNLQLAPDTVGALAIGTPGLLPTPAAPTTLIVGPPGNTTITYFAVAINALGQDSMPSPATTINNAPNVLNGANFVLVIIKPVPGAVAYRFYKNNTSSASAAFGMTADGSVFGGDFGQAMAPTIAATAEPANWTDVIPIQSDHYLIAGPGAAGAAVTLTQAGVFGFTHAITKLKIYRFAAAVLAAAAVPVNVTTSNMGGLIIPIPADAAAQGTMYVEDWSPGLSAGRGINQNTNTVVSCPATPNVIWTINGCFFFSS